MATAGVVAIVASSLVLGACGLGDRQRHADAIHDARARTAQSVRAGSLTYEVKLHPRSRAEFAELTGDAPTGELLLRTDVVVDAKSARSAVRFAVADLPAKAAEPPVEGAVDPAAVEGAPEPAPEAAAAPEPIVAVFDGATVFVKRQNLRARERRTWAQLDFEALPDEEPRPTREDLAGAASLVAVATTLDPVHVLDLAKGALAGSTKLLGTATLEDGAAVTRYEANVSIDKALADLELDDDEIATRLRMLRLLGIRADVVPAAFWIAPDGALRRMEVDVPQYVNRRRSDHLLITLDLQAAATEPVQAAPSAEETVTYQRYGRLLRAAVPAGAA